jgi:hypothetical protein
MFKKIFIFSIIFCLLTELTSYFLSRYGLFLVNETPKLYKKNKNLLNNYEWRDEKHPWGAWHLKSSTADHIQSCWNVQYSSNSLGARGREIENNLQKDIILLGDSFAEGWGLSENELFKTLIEKKYNNNVLNLGVSGDVGPVSYYLIYKQFKDNFKHDNLILLFFPFNDFTDNDLNYFKKNNNFYFHSNIPRYRPYYKKISENNYKIIYPQKAIPRETWDGFDIETDNLLFKLEIFLYDNFWFGNAYKTIKFLFNMNLYEAIFRPRSGYFDSTIDQQKAAVHFLEKIVKMANNKNIFIISIPRPEDLKRLHNSYEDIEDLHWYKSLKKLDKKNNISFIDLAKFIKNDYKNYYHKCDGHFNKYGNYQMFKIFEKFYK